MKKYEKPVVMINEEVAEGVYAASGVSEPGANCWTGYVYEPNEGQDWVGGFHLFRVNATHGGVQHTSAATIITIVFNNILTDAKCQDNTWGCTYSGNTVTITRPNLGNAYGNGDQIDYGFSVTTGDEATTKALAPVVGGLSIRCDYTANVQGNGGDGT